MAIEEARLLTTQMRPSGASARLLGLAPASISASLTREAASKTETVSLSGFTTHRREVVPARGSRIILLDITGAFVVAAR